MIGLIARAHEAEDLQIRGERQGAERQSRQQQSLQKGVIHATHSTTPKPPLQANSADALREGPKTAESRREGASAFDRTARALCRGTASVLALTSAAPVVMMSAWKLA